MTTDTSIHNIGLPFRSLLSALAFVLLLVVAGCGDDGAEASGSNDDSDGSSDTESTDDCEGTDLAFTNLETGVTGTATFALAESSADGALYTAHAADFDITEDDLKSWRPEVPDDGNVITVQLTVFFATEDPAPAEPGTLRWTDEPDELTFGVRHFTADADWSHTFVVGDEDDLVKEMTITTVGDTFCFDIDFTDQEKQVTGTVEAPVFRKS